MTNEEALKKFLLDIDCLNEFHALKYVTAICWRGF